MKKIVFMVEPGPGRAFSARALDEPIRVHADSIEELHAQVREAVRRYFDAGDAARRIRLQFVRDGVSGMKPRGNLSGAELIRGVRVAAR